MLLHLFPFLLLPFWLFWGFPLDEQASHSISISNMEPILEPLGNTHRLDQLLQDTATTFILVRHAEKVREGDNPILNEAGLARAAELSRVLKNIPLSAIYSTNYSRTTQTAEPVAADHQLPIYIYNASALEAFAAEALEKHHKGVLLVVGHSNTTPDLLNVLTGTNDYTDIPETEYDNLFLVSVFEKGRAQVYHLKYGE